MFIAKKRQNDHIEAKMIKSLDELVNLAEKTKMKGVSPAKKKA
jgi:hypothetical protein